MSPDPDLVRAADRNFIGSYEKLAQHQPAGSVRRFGMLTAFVTGLPVSFLNGCVASGQAAAAEMGEAVEWLNKRSYPFEIFIAEDFAAEREPELAARGFERSRWAMPAMWIQPPAEPPPARPGVAVRAVDDRASVDELLAMQIGAGMPEPIARGMFAASFVEDPDVRIFTAYLDGRPAGNAIAIRTGDVSGVYAVGTLPGARRRGVGTAATWAAVAAGHDWGCAAVVLQSSEMGYPVYLAMGFAVLNRYAVFDRWPG